MLTGDMHNADPVCAKSPDHHKILEARKQAESVVNNPDQFHYRNERNSKVFAKGG